MSPPLVRHGWTIAFQPQLFARQYAELKAEVKRLKQELDPQSFVQHPQVKLLAAVMEGIKSSLKNPAMSAKMRQLPSADARSPRAQRLFVLLRVD